jgi:hypothetical protein
MPNGINQRRESKIDSNLVEKLKEKPEGKKISEIGNK